MTVRELIAELRKYDGDYMVVMSTDSEGNWFNPMWQAEGGVYHTGDHTFYDGEDQEDNPDLPGKLSEFENAVCLWPV